MYLSSSLLLYLLCHSLCTFYLQCSSPLLSAPLSLQRPWSAVQWLALPHAQRRLKEKELSPRWSRLLRIRGFFCLFSVLFGLYFVLIYFEDGDLVVLFFFVISDNFAYVLFFGGALALTARLHPLFYSFRPNLQSPMILLKFQHYL